MDRINWVDIAERGLTSAFFAIAFGLALWRIGMKLLDSHLKLVDNANMKMDQAVIELQKGNVISEKIAERVAKLPSDIPECRAPAISEEVADKMIKIAQERFPDCGAADLRIILEERGIIPKKRGG